jgi:hypothetical protein
VADRPVSLAAERLPTGRQQDGRRRRGGRVDACDVALRRAGVAEAQPRLPHQREAHRHQPQAGRDVHDQPEGEVVGRQTHYLEGLPGSVQRAERQGRGVPDRVVHRLRADGERRGGQERARGRRHLRAAVRRLAGGVRSAVSRVHDGRREGVQHRLARQGAGHGGSVQARFDRPDREDHHGREGRHVLGRPGQARPDRVPRAGSGRRGQRVPQRRSDVHERRDERRRAPASLPQGERRAARGTRAGLLRDHAQRHGAQPHGRQRTQGDRAGHRPFGDRGVGADEQSFLRQLAGGVTGTTVARSAGTTRGRPRSCSTKPGGRGARSTARRTANHCGCAGRSQPTRRVRSRSASRCRTCSPASACRS